MKEKISKKFEELFHTTGSFYTSPGRINLIGEHTDYNGGFVFPGAIDKGMPIEQVQVLLGHRKIDTTLQYAMVNQNNVKNSHKRFIC